MTMPSRNTETLSILPTFQALLEHGSVSAAADALGLTQSAISKHLTRLRVCYGDPLFVRTPSGMQPTPHAVWMAPRVAAILSEATELMNARAFDPRDLSGQITLSTTDEVSWALMPGLLRVLEAEAPDLRLTVKPLQPDYSHRELETGQTDLVISVNWHAPETLKQGRLFSDRFVYLLSSDNPCAQNGLELQAFADCPHIMVAPLGMQTGTVDEALAQHDLARFVQLSIPDFHQISPQLLSGKRVATLPERVALSLQARYPDAFVVHPLPFDLPAISYYCLWHSRYDKDRRSQWVREKIRQVLKAGD